MRRYTPNGTNILDIARVLKGQGINAQVYTRNNTVASLQKLVSPQAPAIVRLDLDGTGHFVVLDNIVKSNEELLFKIRDPWQGLNYGLKQTDFEQLWKNGLFISTKE